MHQTPSHAVASEESRPSSAVWIQRASTGASSALATSASDALIPRWATTVSSKSPIRPTRGAGFANGRSSIRGGELDRLRAAMDAADHHGAGELVVPSLLAWIPGDPKESQPERQRGQEIAEVSPDQ